MSPAELAAYADAVKNGLLALAVLVLAVGGMRQWYVWGWLYRDVVKDRDEWKAIAMRGAHLAQRAASVAEKVASSTK